MLLKNFYVTQDILLFIRSRDSFYVWLTDANKNKAESFYKQCLLSSAINNKENETWKAQCESTQWKAQCIVHKNSMENTVKVCWCQNKLTYGMVLFFHIYKLLHF